MNMDISWYIYRIYSREYGYNLDGEVFQVCNTDLNHSQQSRFGDDRGWTSLQVTIKLGIPEIWRWSFRSLLLGVAGVTWTGDFVESTQDQSFPGRTPPRNHALVENLHAFWEHFRVYTQGDCSWIMRQPHQFDMFKTWRPSTLDGAPASHTSRGDGGYLRAPSFLFFWEMPTWNLISKNINVTNRKCVYEWPLIVFRFDCVMSFQGWTHWHIANRPGENSPFLRYLTNLTQMGLWRNAGLPTNILQSFCGNWW